MGSGVTLTNKGTIYVDDTLTYGGSCGDLRNSGNIYYLLKVTGGTDTNGTVTYPATNGKTYAEAETDVTVAPPGKVGQKADRFTCKVNGEAQEMEAGGIFRMPGQVTTVDIVDPQYSNDPGYTVTIPASVNIHGTGTAAIEAENVNVAEGCSLNVTLTATSGTDNAFTLALADHKKETLTYTVTLAKTTVKLGTGADAQETTPGSGVEKDGTVVLSIPGGTADSSGSSTLTFALASGRTEKYSGTYSGTVTFTVSGEKAP